MGDKRPDSVSKEKANFKGQPERLCETCANITGETVASLGVWYFKALVVYTVVWGMQNAASCLIVIDVERPWT
jgi:hypothetical protein